MRRNSSRLVIVAIAVIVAAASCATTNLTTNKTGWSDYAGIAIKDFSVAGHVRVESEETTVVGVLGFTRSFDGGKVTYDMLLAAAKKLGADDIINVRIDSSRTDKRSLFDFITGYTSTRKYVGNALAIKYTAAQPNFREKDSAGTTGMLRDASPSAIIDMLGL